MPAPTDNREQAQKNPPRAGWPVVPGGLGRLVTAPSGLLGFFGGGRSGCGCSSSVGSGCGRGSSGIGSGSSSRRSRCVGSGCCSGGSFNSGSRRRCRGFFFFATGGQGHGGQHGGENERLVHDVRALMLGFGTLWDTAAAHPRCDAATAGFALRTACAQQNGGIISHKVNSVYPETWIFVNLCIQAPSAARSTSRVR